jgi:16S rRNA (guanine966-N2)-methyltransferase
MRIIAGLRRGHKFEGPIDRDTRPTSDLVREALFNILRDSVEDCAVVDLFAGTGALGLEALSRGATRAVFVERNRENAALIRNNLTTLKFEDRGNVLQSDAYRWVKGFQPKADEPFVIFLDPPWDEYKKHKSHLELLIEEIHKRVPDGSTVVVESGEELSDEWFPEPESWDRRRYGGTHLAIFTKGGVLDEDDEVEESDEDEEPSEES